MVDFALNNTDVDFLGHKATGWSDDADALSMPNVDIASVKRGADGKQVAVSTGEKGGQVVLKFSPNSPSAKYFAMAVVAQKNGFAVRWEAFIKYVDTGITTFLDGGTITNAPPAQSLGKGDAANYEITFEFEEITSDYLASKL